MRLPCLLLLLLPLLLLLLLLTAAVPAYVRCAAWYELFMYETAAREAKQAIEEGVVALELEALAVDVPTSGLRFKKN